MSYSNPKYQFGDPVWSKMKGYCPWPSRIGDPSESPLKNTLSEKVKGKNCYLVFFFGSNNWAWMPEDTIKPYGENKDKNEKGSKTVQFKQGLKQIQEYIARGGKDSLSLHSGVAIQSSDNAGPTSPSTGGDSLINDNSNLDASGELPSLEEELAIIRNAKPTPTSKRSKNSHDSQYESSSITSPVPSSVHKDYSRSPYSKSRKSTKSSVDEPAAEVTSPTKRLKTFDDDNYGSTTLSSSTLSPSAPKPASRVVARNPILKATSQYNDSPIADIPRINFNSVSAKNKNIRPSTLKFGFIGLGFMGQRLLKNLLNTGHKVTIYNRSTEKCDPFVKAGAEMATTPGDVVAAADIVFGCLKDAAASKEIIFGTFGVLGEMNPTKGYVEMSGIDSETSKDIFEAIIARGGSYLEAPALISGKKAAEDGELVIVASGDRKIYDDCSTCFQAMAKKTFYLGSPTGLASKLNLIVGSLYGILIGGLSECCTIVDRSEFDLGQFKEIIKLLPIYCPIIDTCMDKISNRTTTVPEIPLEHVKRHLSMTLQLADDMDQHTPIAAIVNEIFKSAKKLGLREHDASSTYIKSRY